MIALHHGRFTAALHPQGAELRSLTRDGQELLWQAGPAWPQTAPWLFPWIGRMRGHGYRHAGRRHPMPLHGFAAASLFTQEGDSRFVLRNSAATRAVYPFAFALSLDARLDDAGLHLRATLRNESPEVMPFAFGAHPGFALDGPLSDWAVQFEADEHGAVWRLDPASASLAPASEPVDWEAPGRLRLHADRFARDALVWKQFRSRRIALLHRERGEHLAMALHGDGFPQFGLWARPGAPYVCLEPWFGHDDAADAPEALMDKPQARQLAPGASWCCGFSIELNGASA